ncbi:MAG TPA: hypothetical protein PLQ76_05135, partial [bacterium]|nr:hypothetical protein [bacterium]
MKRKRPEAKSARFKTEVTESFYLTKKFIKIISFAAIAFFISKPASATPSTQIWIPSTDIQKKGTFHLGIDNYFTMGTDNTWSMPTDVGIEYGIAKGWEVGIDVM